MGIFSLVGTTKASFLFDINEQMNPIQVSNDDENIPMFLSKISQLRNNEQQQGNNNKMMANIENMVRSGDFKGDNNKPLTALIARRFQDQFLNKNLPDNISDKLHTKMRMAKTFKKLITLEQQNEIPIEIEI